MTATAVVPFIAFVGTGTLGPFALTKGATPIYFENNSDIVVYRYDTVDDVTPTLLTESSDYTLTGGPSAGSITLIGAQTALLSTERLLVYRQQTLEQLTDFPTTGDFNSTTMNTTLDRLERKIQELDRQIKQAIRLPGMASDTLPDTTPLEAVQGKIFYIGGTPAAPTIQALADVTGFDVDLSVVADNITAINTVYADLIGADTIGIVAADMLTIAAVAADATDIGTVAGIASEIEAVNADAADIGTVATDLTGANTIGTVAGIAAAISTVAGISANVTTVAGISANVTTVAGIASAISTVAGISSDVSTVAGISAAVSAVAADATDIGTVAADLSGSDTIGTVAGLASEIATIAAGLSAGTIPTIESGFQARSETTISFTDGTRTFTITPTGSDYTYWQGGGRYVPSSADTVVIPDTEGVHYIYYDGATLSSTTTFSIDLYTTYALVAAVYWDATNNEAILILDARHEASMAAATLAALHFTDGAKYETGLGLSNMDTDGSGANASAAQLEVINGKIWNEDIRISIDHGSPQTLNGAPAQIPLFYRSGASSDWRRLAATAYPVTTTGSGRAAWNEDTGATWQLTEVTDTQFVLMHYFATGDVEHPVIGIVGQAEYASITAARTGADEELASLNLAGISSIYAEMVAIATVIFETDSTYTNAVKARTRTTEAGGDFTDWRAASSGGSGGGGGGSAAWGGITGTLANQTDLQTALDAKAPTASPTFTGTATFQGEVFVEDAINYDAASVFYIRSRFNGGTVQIGTETSGGTLYYPIVINGATDTLVFNNSTSEMARFDSSGNVVIGATSALGTVHISETGKAGGGAPALYIGAMNANTESDISLHGNAVIGGETSVTHTFEGSGYIRFGQATASETGTAGISEKVRINATGLGIGTASPNALLDVSASADPTIRLSNQKDGTWTAGEAFGTIEFWGTDGSGEGDAVKVEIGAVSHNTFGAAHRLRIRVSDGTNGLVESMSIEVDGDIVFYDTTGSQGLTWDAATNRLAVNHASGRGQSTLDIVANAGFATATAGTGEGFRIGVGVDATDPALFMGITDGATDYAWIQAIDPGTVNYPLSLNPNGGEVAINRVEGRGGANGQGLDLDDGPLVITPIPYSASQSGKAIIFSAQNYDGTTTNWGTDGLSINVATDSGGTPRLEFDMANDGVVLAVSGVSTGRVGIKRTDPEAELDVTGSIVGYTELNTPVSGTLVLSDHLRGHTNNISGNITMPTGAAGAGCDLTNNSGTTRTISKVGGLSNMFVNGVSASSATLAGRGHASVRYTASNLCHISGDVY